MNKCKTERTPTPTDRAHFASLVRALIEGSGKKYFVLTFGCQQNVADSEKISGMAEEMGYIPTDKPEDASLIVVNTCAVREHAEKKALSIIGQYKHCKARNPELIVAVCGCMPSQVHRADEIKHKYPYVDFTFGTTDLYMLPELLYLRLDGGRRRFMPCTEKPPVVEDIPTKREDGYRGWVSIMYGCNNFCSYCIVPYVRGRERSRHPDAVEAEVRELIYMGCKEIT
jgi:tRNA-2-methylthio-N6-dimethylallyladenosine synthase